MLKRWPGWVLLGLVVVGLLAVGTSRESGPRTSEERVEEISKRLACPICDGESVFESRNNASAGIREEIRRQVETGQRTDEQIITFFEQRYDASILLVPRASGLDALVWVLPVMAMVCAIAGLAVAFRRWRLAADLVPTEGDRALVEGALRRADDPDDPDDPDDADHHRS